MSKISLKIENMDGLKKITKGFVIAANEGIFECATDLKRVSEGLTPIKTGKLTKSCNVKKGKQKGLDSYTLSYSAVNKYNFDYAVPMHNSTYNLGPESSRRVPTRSAYSDKSFKVGAGYLVGTANELKKDYAKHLNEKIRKSKK